MKQSGAEGGRQCGSEGENEGAELVKGVHSTHTRSSSHCPHMVVEEGLGSAGPLVSLAALGVEAVQGGGFHQLWERAMHARMEEAQYGCMRE